MTERELAGCQLSSWFENMGSGATRPLGRLAFANPSLRSIAGSEWTVLANAIAEPARVYVFESRRLLDAVAAELGGSGLRQNGYTNGANKHTIYAVVDIAPDLHFDCFGTGRYTLRSADEPRTNWIRFRDSLGSTREWPGDSAQLRAGSEEPC
jgi:hypothetical protein